MNELSEHRKRDGIKVCVTGIAANVFLFVLKFVLGTITASIAVIADGFNNLSDAASSIVTLISFKVAAKRPDAQHPFGYGRIEYISALIVSFLILVTGLSFFKDSIVSCVHPEPLHAGVPVFIGLILSVAIKAVLGLYTKKMGKRLDSVSLVAAGTDSLNDVLVTVATIISVAVSAVSSFCIDGYAGIIVSLLIIKAGIEVIKNSLGPLLGQPADPALVQAIERMVLSGEGITGVHDLVVHNYGPSRALASAHAEIPSDCNLIAMHDVIDHIESQINNELNVKMTIHFDPIDTRSEIVASMRAKVAEIVQSVSKDLLFHDFRMVSGPTHTNLIFDIVYPYNCPLSESAVLHEIRSRIDKLEGKFFAVIQVDYPHV